MLKSLASLVFPPRCIGCDCWLTAEALGLCANCFSRLNFLPAPAHLPHLKPCYADIAYSTLAYEGVVLQWIHQFKYHRQFYLGKALVPLMAAMDLEWDSFDCLVPAPLHWWRRLRRGFNPSHLLAYRLGRQLNKTVLPCLSKSRRTPPQTKLSRTERLKNVKGSFTISSKAQTKIAKKSLLLIDDVLTTGATVNECAKVLKKAGAKQVAVLTLARTL